MPRSRVSIGLLGAGQWCKVCAHPKSAVSSVPRPLSERMKKAAATMYETASHSLSSMTAHAQRGAKPNSRRAQLEWELGQQPLPAVRAGGARQAGGAGSGWRAGRGLGRTLHVGRRAAPLLGTDSADARGRLRFCLLDRMSRGRGAIDQMKNSGNDMRQNATSCDKTHRSS